MSHPTWDLNLKLKDFKKVLKHPEDKRFLTFFSRVLSRVPFYDVFHGFMTPQEFKKHYPRVRKRLETDLLGAGRLPFWNWLYRKIS